MHLLHLILKRSTLHKWTGEMNDDTASVRISTQNRFFLSFSLRRVQIYSRLMFRHQQNRSLKGSLLRVSINLWLKHCYYADLLCECRCCLEMFSWYQIIPLGWGNTRHVKLVLTLNCWVVICVSPSFVYVSEPPCFTRVLVASVFFFGLSFSQSQHQEPSLTITTRSLSRFSFCFVLPEEEILILDMPYTECCNIM